MLFKLFWLFTLLANLTLPGLAAASLVFEAGLFGIPKNNNANKLGEDSCFISESVLGLADGVGEWSEMGIDAGEYSRKLMTNSLEEFSKVPEFQSPHDILEAAFNKMGDTKGSTTAILLALDNENQRLNVANLGDSGFLYIRPSPTKNGPFGILKISQSQELYFNCPYQLGLGTPNKAKDADLISVDNVQINDIVVVYSDGVSDNLFPQEIATLIKEGLEKNLSPDALAKSIANKAFQISNCPTEKTPFQIAAWNARIRHNGGKKDDITVIVAKVVLKDESAPVATRFYPITAENEVK